MVKNSRKHKKEISKDIKKRIKKIAKQSRADTGDVSTGSRVVKRTRADISKAPAYKAEKLKTSNFHSTFPVSNGLSLFDEQMNMQRLFQQGLKRQKQQNEFKLLIDQGLAGNLDVDNMTNEMKQELAKQYAMQENDNKKNKMLKEIDRLKDQREKLNDENFRLAEKHKGLHLKTKSKKTGDDKIIAKSALRKRVNIDRGELEEIQEKSNLLKRLTNKEEILKNAKDQLANDKKQVQKLFRNLPSSEQNTQIMRAIEQEDMLQLKLHHDSFDREVDNVHENIKLFKQYGEKAFNLMKDKRDMDLVRKEIKEMGDHDGNLTKKLVDLEHLYGHDQDRLRENLRETINELIEQGKKVKEHTTILREYEAAVKRFDIDYTEEKKNFMRKAQDVIAMDRYSPNDVRELAHQKMLNEEQIRRVLESFKQRRYSAHEVFSSEMAKIYDNISYHDAEMADFDRELRNKLVEFLEPVVEHYSKLDIDIDEDAIEREKNAKSFEVWKNLAGMYNVDAVKLIEQNRAERRRAEMERNDDEDYILEPNPN